MRKTRLLAGFLAFVVMTGPAVEAGAIIRGDLKPGAGRSTAVRAKTSVPPPGKPAVHPGKPPPSGAGHPGHPAGGAPGYRPLPPYPPNWHSPGPLPAGYHPPYPPPPGYRPYPPPPGFAPGIYPPRYYPGYRPPVLVYPYPGYPFTPGEVFVGGLVVGMVIAAISESAQPVEVNNTIVYYDGEYYYEPVTDGDEVVYKVVPPPPGV